jgi:hypothetical protein
MDKADLLGFYGDGDHVQRRGETRSRASVCLGAKGVARAFAFLYPLSLVGRLVKRKVSRAAHRVADHAADRVAERAARILRDERIAEEQARLALAADARADPLEALEEERDPKDESSGEDSAADDAADDAATADVALQCEMEEEAKTPATLSDARKATTEREEDAFGASPTTPERTTTTEPRGIFPRTINPRPALSPPPSGWDFVSEDGA